MASGGVQGEAPLGEGADGDVDAHTLASWIHLDIADTARRYGGEPSVRYLPDVLPYYDGAAPDMDITAVGTRVQVTVGPDVVCLTLSPDGNGEGVSRPLLSSGHAPGPLVSGSGARPSAGWPSPA